MYDAIETNIINGVDVDAVQNLIATVGSNPGEGATHWKVKSAWQGGTHNRSTVESFHIGGREVKRDFTIDIDEPKELAGGNCFANPQEYLLAALNSCMMVGYVALCSLQGIRIDSLEIETEGDIDLSGFLGLSRVTPPGYESLSYTVRISGDASADKFAEIHEMVKATSPNFYNLANAVRLNATLKVG